MKEFDEDCHFCGCGYKSYMKSIWNKRFGKESKTMKYIPVWYDQDSIVKEDTPIEASDESEARDKAYIRYNGNPPAPLLYLKRLG